MTKANIPPDHERWINARINSHVLEQFKEGPFGHYLGLHLPVTTHGKVLHSILKRQIEYTSRSENASPPRDDDMWFGLGSQQHRFGQVEFCLCSGVKMGKLPEGLIKAITASNNSLKTFPEPTFVHKM